MKILKTTGAVQLPELAEGKPQVATHDAAGLATDAEKGAANGYPSLGPDILVPQDQLGTGTQDGTKFLRDDGTWQVAAAMGGSPAEEDYVAASEAVLSASYADLSTVGPEVEIGIGSDGKVEVTIGCGMRNTTVNQQVWSSFEVYNLDTSTVALAPDDSRSIFYEDLNDVARPNHRLGRSFLVTGLVAGNYRIRQKYKSTGGTGAAYDRRLHAIVPTGPKGDLGVSDHGALTGLADDDHTQYQKESEKGAANGYLGIGASIIQAPFKFYPVEDDGVAQTAAGFYAGTGVPNNANGSNGDFYFRSDGGALTTIYQRRAGAWVGII